jgi:hypothetical protein
MHRSHLPVVASIVLGLLSSLAAAADPRYGDATLPETVQTQLRALSPRRTDHTTIYGVIVGGDAGDEVFRKETLTVRAALDLRVGTKGRSLVLLNHRSLPAPEATFNSIRQVLHAVAERMDRDRDVLWLHLASHGARDSGLVLSYPGRALYWLTPEHLHKMLDEAHIRYRIVVVSACYSGGFVPPLRDPGTIVATASAATTKAYGCGNASDITDFSRALYLEAFDRADSMLAALRLAQQIVHQKESTEHITHSYPQVVSGAAIESLSRHLPLNR